MRLIHTSDLHLTSGDEPRARCAFDAFRRVCALARERAADLLVVAGDAFHGPSHARDAALLGRVRAELDALAPAKALLIPGNHELHGGADFRSASDLGPNCEVFVAPGVASFGPVKVHAFPFRKGGRSAEAFAGLPAPAAGELRVAVLHGTAVDRPDLAMYAAEAENREEGGDFLILDRDLARAGFAYAALGHVHKPDSWDLPHGGKAAYAGAPWCVTVGEEAPRSAVVVDLDPAARALRLEAVALGTPRAVRRSFFATPGGEEAVLAEAEAFFRSQPADAWPVAYVKGLADKALLARRKCEVEARAAAGRPLPPEIRLRDRELRDLADAPGPLQKRFLERMRERIAAAQGEEREVLIYAAVFGSLALDDPGGRPEEELLDSLEEARR